MTVVLLKQALSARSLSTTGRKPELVARLEAVIGTAGPAKPPQEVCLLDLRGSPHLITSSCGTALSCQACSLTHNWCRQGGVVMGLGRGTGV